MIRAIFVGRCTDFFAVFSSAVIRVVNQVRLHPTREGIGFAQIREMGNQIPAGFLTQVLHPAAFATMTASMTQTAPSLLSTGTVARKYSPLREARAHAPPLALRATLALELAVPIVCTQPGTVRLV